MRVRTDDGGESESAGAQLRSAGRGEEKEDGQVTIDERLEALTMNLELQAREGEAQRERIEALRRLVELDAENIRSLARIAEAHERRLDRIEGGA